MEGILIVFAMFIIGWEVFWWMAGVRPIGPLGLRRMLKASAGTKPFLVDVRTDAEFKLFHIKGAESQPSLLFDPGSLKLPDRE